MGGFRYRFSPASQISLFFFQGCTYTKTLSYILMVNEVIGGIDRRWKTQSLHIITICCWWTDISPLIILFGFLSMSDTLHNVTWGNVNILMSAAAKMNSGDCTYFEMMEVENTHPLFFIVGTTINTWEHKHYKVLVNHTSETRPDRQKERGWI